MVVERNHVLPASRALLAALVDGKKGEKEHTFIRSKGIGWGCECGVMYGFPVVLKNVDDSEPSLLNGEEEGMDNETQQQHVGVKTGKTTITANSSICCQRHKEDMKSIHVADGCDMGHSCPSPIPPCNRHNILNHGLDAILLVEFEGETGCGTGRPTQEFYTLVCHEARKSGLGLWHGYCDPKYGTFLNPPEGLFPKPHLPGSRELNSAISLFCLLGRVVGKSLKDGHRLDLPLALPLCKILVGGEGGLTLKDVERMDVMTGQSLKDVLSLYNRLSTTVVDCTIEDEEAVAISMRKLKHEAEKPCLTWSLPGYSWYALRPREMACNKDIDPEDLGRCCYHTFASKKCGTSAQGTCSRH